METKTYAAWIPTCKTCGSTSVATVPQAKSTCIVTLQCGHPVEIMVIRNPALPPLPEQS